MQSLYPCPAPQGCHLLYRAYSLSWPASMQIYGNKRNFLHKERVQLLQSLFGTPIWPLWSHVNMLCGVPWDLWCHSKWPPSCAAKKFWFKLAWKKSKMTLTHSLLPAGLRDKKYWYGNHIWCSLISSKLGTSKYKAKHIVCELVKSWNARIPIVATVIYHCELLLINSNQNASLMTILKSVDHEQSFILANTRDRQKLGSSKYDSFGSISLGAKLLQKRSFT